jgi:hypothetical protein
MVKWVMLGKYLRSKFKRKGKFPSFASRMYTWKYVSVYSLSKNKREGYYTKGDITQLSMVVQTASLS